MAEQSFKNHGRYVPLFHFFVLPVLLASVVVQSYWWVKTGFMPGRFFSILLAFAFFAGFLSVRMMVLRVQDRVIRLEERLRMTRLLPQDLQARIGEFTPRQLIALRFASDEELPELARKVLTENMTDLKVIKRAIKNWRADYLRA